MTTTKADNQLHAFRTFMGLPPDSDTPPVCGAVLTAAYSGRGKPHCPRCDRAVRLAARPTRHPRDHRATS